MRRPDAKTLAGVVAEYAGQEPTRPAIFYGDEDISYSDLLHRADTVARALVGSGIKAGDRVGVLLGNEPDWVIVALAASMVGVTLCPLNTWYKMAELLWTIGHSTMKLLVCTPRYLKTDYVAMFGEMVEEAGAASLPELVFTREAPAWAIDWDDFLKRGQGITGDELAAVQARVSPDTAAFVLYTSGSTAEPKGVLLNHRGVVENGFDMAVRRGMAGNDRVWLGSPLFYGLGATNALPATFTVGAALVLQGHFEAGAAIDVIHRTEATVFYGTGNMTRAILDHPDFTRAKIGSLQKGNAGTMAEYKRLTLVEMGISGAVPAYGLTECYGNATVGEPDDPLEVKIATNGRPLSGMEMIIVDPETGKPLPQGETGLVLLRGYTTPGYLNNPEETRRVCRPDGFFDTGDLGSLDPEGRFIFHSRIKEVIKSGGINVSPVEVEQNSGGSRGCAGRLCGGCRRSGTGRDDCRLR